MWMPLGELDAAPIDLIAVSVDGLFGAFGESPSETLRAHGGLRR